MIYVTSDLHFGHTNIIKYAHRPFKSVEEMDNTLIENWNSVVTEDDQVFVLGDFSMRTRIEEVQAYLSRLNGRIVLLKGNHDYFTEKQHMPFVTYYKTIDGVPKEYKLPVYQYKEMNYEKNKFIMMHYPFAEWNGMQKGTIDLHGHIHTEGSAYNCAKRKDGFRMFDVGVDANNYKPVSLDYILNFYKDSKIAQIYHGKREA